MWLTATHIPRISNFEADAQSRTFNDRTEWKLDAEIFQILSRKILNPEIDLSASRLNCQIKPFISWGPDPESYAVDAFTVNSRTSMA